MKRLFFIILTIIPALLAFADDVNFKAQAPKTVVSGQQFRIEYIVNAQAKDLRTSEFTGFEVLMGPIPSINFSRAVINGKASSQSTTVFTFTLLAVNEGTFNIPEATVKVDGKQYTSNSLTIKVLPPDKASEAEGQQNGGSTSGSGVGANDVLYRLNLSKKNVYEGEAIVATLKLYTVNPQTQISSLKYPSFEGFTVQDIELPDQKSFDLENVSGRNYYTVALRQYLLFPQRAGSIEIAPSQIDVDIPVRVQQSVRSIFDDIFDNYQNVTKSLATPKITVNVESLPFGKPESFLGGVGDFSMTSSISTQQLKANDALTLKVVISGTGNLKYTKDPELKLPADVESFDPKVDVNVKVSSAGMKGTKTIEYTIIPRYAGEFEIPVMNFSYFDSKSKTYKTLSTTPYKISVEKGDQTTPSSITNFSGANQEDVRLLGSDVRFIKSGDLKVSKNNGFFYGSVLFYLSYILPILLFIIIVIVYRKQVKENANLALMRTKKANKVASKRLKAASAFLKEHKSDSFYEEMLKAVWGYLSDKLNIPTSSLTKDNVENELQSHNVDQSLINEFIEIVETCEFARYSPAQSNEAMDKLYEKTVDAINKMESVIKK